MKDLIIVSVMFLTCNISNGQSYYTEFAQNNSIDNIEIIIDTAYASNGIFVEKRFYSSEINVNLYNPNSLILLGSFDLKDNAITLNYPEYNYYWIPFDPNEPFRSLNYTVDANTTVGKLYFGSSGAQERSVGPGDLWFFCSCNSDINMPGGCSSSLNGNEITCVNDGCGGYCMGYALESSNSIVSGGGILIQVTKNKNILYHNFKTAK